MKRRFLFSLLFLFVSLIVLINSQVSLAAISSVTTNTPSVGQTGATLSGTVDMAGASELYDRRGFNLGTASAAGGNYDIGSSSDTGGPWAGDGTFTHATTSLSQGTVYYFRAYVASSTVPQLTYGSEASFLTGIADPSSLAKTAATINSMDLSWTKGTGAGNTYLRYRTDRHPSSITDGNNGCTGSGTSCTVGSLSCGTSYYFGAWSSTTAAELSTTSDSSVQVIGSTSACIGSGGCAKPGVLADSLVINQGIANTPTREVTLSLKADSAMLMSICNNSSFIGCSLESYSTTKSWTLTEGEGAKTVYALFTSNCGANSDSVSDAITFQIPVAPASTPTPIPTSEPTPAPAVPSTSAPASTPAPVEKPVSQMTTAELQVKIAEILSQIKVLQDQLAGLKETVTFEVNLKYGDQGDEVVKLQEVLIKEGLLAQDLNTGWFGSLTKAAVIKFQEKYASEILNPSGLIKGTGFVASATRAKLNKLLGK